MWVLVMRELGGMRTTIVFYFKSETMVPLIILIIIFTYLLFGFYCLTCMKKIVNKYKITLILKVNYQ